MNSILKYQNNKTLKIKCVKRNYIRISDPGPVFGFQNINKYKPLKGNYLIKKKFPGYFCMIYYRRNLNYFAKIQH
jgi:hypothetical protein